MDATVHKNMLSNDAQTLLSKRRGVLLDFDNHSCLSLASGEGGGGGNRKRKTVMKSILNRNNGDVVIIFFILIVPLTSACSTCQREKV